MDVIRLEKSGHRARTITIEVDDQAVVCKTNGKGALRVPHQGDAGEIRRIVNEQLILHLTQGAKLVEAPGELLSVPLLQCEVSPHLRDVEQIHAQLPKVKGWRRFKPGGTIIDFASSECAPLMMWFQGFDAATVGKLTIQDGTPPSSNVTLLSRGEVRAQVIAYLHHYPQHVVDWAKAKGILPQHHGFVVDQVFL